MPTTADELIVARSWIGNTETQSAFDERFDRHFLELGDREGSLESAIEESLRAQLQAMVLDRPASMSLPGGISASFGENMRILKENLEKFTATVGSGSVKISQLIREETR